MKKVIIIFGGLAVILTAVFVYSNKTSADEYSPADFSADYKKFEVSVGYDQKNGRYETLHYEFND